MSENLGEAFYEAWKKVYVGNLGLDAQRALSDVPAREIYDSVMHTRELCAGKEHRNYVRE